MTNQNQLHAETPAATTTAAPEPTPASTAAPLTPPAPAPETSSSASSDVGTAGAEAEPTAKRSGASSRKRSKSRQHKGSTAGERTETKGKPSGRRTAGLVDRLLARVELPRVTLERRLLPPKLVAALDAAGLGTPALLPSSAFMSLAAIGAIAGPHVRCEPADGAHGMMGGGLALRVALLAPDRRASPVPAAIMAGAYAAENDQLDLYNVSVERGAERRRAAEQRRRVHEQAVRAAMTLGIPSPPPLTDAIPAKLGARPRIVVLDGAGAAIRAAAAGLTGVLVVDERRVASMAHIGDFHDEPTDALLNAASSGHAVPIADPATGRITMRSFPAGVIGCLAATEFASLHHAGAEQLAATVFVTAAAPPPAGDGAALVELMRSVRAIGDEPVVLRLPAQGDALKTAAAAWSEIAAANTPPLSDFLAGLPDLVRRLAALLHLAATAGAAGGPGGGIAPATVQRAVAIVNTVVVPAAQAVLGPISSSEVERDARRIIAHLQAITSLDHRTFERRTIMRAWQKTMPVPRLDAALGLLLNAGLVAALDKTDAGKGGGQRFEVAEHVYAAA